METKRQLDVLNQHLANHDYIAADEYSVADMAIYPWYGWLVLGKLYVTDSYDAATFLDVDNYPNVQKWAKRIAVRDAVQQAEKLTLQPIN